MFQNINSKQKFYFSIVAVFIILAFLIFGVIFPLMGKIKNSARDFLSGKKTLSVLEKEIKEVKSLEKKHQEIKNISSQLETVFLDLEETLDFITSLEKIAEETDNSLKIEGFSGSEKEGFIRFQISLSGSFSSLIQFLTGLENVPYPPYRLVGVETIDVRKLSQGELQTNLGIKTYYK